MLGAQRIPRCPVLRGNGTGRDALGAALAWPPSKLAVLAAAGAGGPGKVLQQRPTLIATIARDGMAARARFSHCRGGAPRPLPAHRREGGPGWRGRAGPAWREPSLRGGGGLSPAPEPGAILVPGSGGEEVSLPELLSRAPPRLAWLLDGLFPGKDEVSRPARVSTGERRCVTASPPCPAGTAWC